MTMRVHMHLLALAGVEAVVASMHRESAVVVE